MSHLNYPPCHFLMLVFVGMSVSAFAATGNTPQSDSRFTKRMMSLDQNKDGLLSENEVPLALRGQLKSADKNQDGKWSADELNQLSQQAPKGRTNPPTNSNDKKETVKSNGSGRRGSAGRSGRGSRHLTSGPGSPLDVAQILKFALTFDLNKDGGLDREELKQYADALAVRRGQARKLQESVEENTMPKKDNKKTTSIPTAEPRDPAGVSAEKASGLKSKSQGSDSDPFGSGKK